MSEDGKHTFGCHSTKDKAEAQLRAIEAAKHHAQGGEDEEVLVDELDDRDDGVLREELQKAQVQYEQLRLQVLQAERQRREARYAEQQGAREAAAADEKQHREEQEQKREAHYAQQQAVTTKALTELAVSVTAVGERLATVQTKNTEILQREQAALTQKIVELAARKPPKGARRDPKTGEWRFQYGKD